jgi:hypothetical protein
MVASGLDDLCEEGSYEFGNVKAISNSETELAMGREPMEMSRPTTTTRARVRPLIFHTELPPVSLMTVSSWSLKASAYTLSCQPKLPLSLVARFVAFSLSPLRQREFTHASSIICYRLIKLVVPFPAPGRCALSIAREGPIQTSTSGP